VASLTVERYVKAIYKICDEGGHHAATTGQIATALRVSPGTVTSMLKTLRENGLAIYAPYEGVRLTEQGNQLAIRLLKRHRLLELFLTKVLGVKREEVHDDADQLEHAVSEFLIERIDAYLGHPHFVLHREEAEGDMDSQEELSQREPVRVE